MASDTERLKLLKKDPLTDGNETFNIQTMLNDNWDKLDEAVGGLQDEIANLDPEIPEGSTTQKGIVQLSSATNSTSETLASTPKAVKAAYDLANSKIGPATEIPPNSNLNDYTTEGQYYVPLTATAATIANVPNAEAFNLEVKKHGAGGESRGVIQVFTTYYPTNLRIYERSLYNGTWGAWKEVVTSDQTSAWQKYSLTDINGRALNITGQDLNNITTGGFYNGSNLKNAPDSTSWWYVEVIAHTNNNGYTLQKAYIFNSGVRSMHIRKQEGGTWGAWYEVAIAGGAIKGGLWIAQNTTYGTATGLDLAIGDSDTGFDWVADGQIDFYTNNQVPVRLIGQEFHFKNTSGTYENLAVAIDNLKSSVANGKNDIAAAIRDKGQASQGSDPFATMAAAIRNINTLSKVASGDFNIFQQDIPCDSSTTTTRTYSGSVRGLDFTPRYVFVNVMVQAFNGDGTLSVWLSNLDSFSLSNTMNSNRAIRQLSLSLNIVSGGFDATSTHSYRLSSGSGNMSFSVGKWYAIQ
ncbi:pyocin knob domain-containing protein [Paenibacillus sp. p-8]